MNAHLLSEIPFPPQGILIDFIWSLLGVLMMGVLVLSFLVQWKKVFGKVPSLDVIISGLMTAKEFENYETEQHLRNRGIEEQISKIRHDASDALMAVVKRGEERDRELRLMGAMVERLRERTENHIRKLDQYDGKLDRLIERMGQTIQGGRKAHL